MDGRHYIGGQWLDDAPNGRRAVENPSDGAVFAQAPNGSAELASQAVMAAREGFERTDWGSSPRLRAAVLLEFADILESRADDIAHLMSQENGKVLAQASHEVAAGYGEARYYAGVARNVFGRTFESAPGKMSLMTREPAGVVSVIVPWNAPVTLLVRSVAPALAAGCAVVVKPAPQTPLTNAAVMACFDAVASLPKGVINSVNEHGTEVGTLLSTHPEIDVISFTGSSRTGKVIMANAAQTIKHVSLELGGKAPALVFGDADLDLAVAEIKRGVLALNGQMCTCISRILVQDSAYDEMRARLRDAFEATVTGDARAPGTELGPIIDRPNQQRLLGIIQRAADEAQMVLRGTSGGNDLARGYFITPSIFEIDDIQHDLVQDELFGPIASLERFSDEAEALHKANATRFGLAASVYTRDLGVSMRMARKLKFGTVWLNSHNRLLAEVETGGYRESGIGRLHGVEAMNDFLETKHIYYEVE
ncbi:Aldehyde dehydrogenase [Candidatus Rhodobacter oscarellae]|uniref:Aldehyde dehydrogenase n=1 Tax=Candidatus Rhodobacter oscarellae TaxID=1675527 RepID=A0A0J9E364_9RHOB|nr:aldehyde dehydrogenase family protein [Candidatus Rhodobacter lobularis]KMW57190.1 Aldehyde dehydrogenase [Candidatus Rhodobacter lobularis]